MNGSWALWTSFGNNHLSEGRPRMFLRPAFASSWRHRPSWRQALGTVSALILVTSICKWAWNLRSGELLRVGETVGASDDTSRNASMRSWMNPRSMFVPPVEALLIAKVRMLRKRRQYRLILKLEFEW